MSVRFVNPHNVSHGSTQIASVVEATCRCVCADQKELRGDDEVFASGVEATSPRCEVELLTEDVSAAFDIAVGTRATLQFDVKDAGGGDDLTVTASNAAYLGPSERFEGGKAAPGTAAMRFLCYSSNGGPPIAVA